jgi:DNA-binding CsgD family transcriptional regulator
MGLNDRQKKIAELYAIGTPVTDIAKLCGVSRPTIYSNLDNDEVKAEVSRCLSEIKNQVEKKVMNKLDSYVSEMDKLALLSKSEKTRLEALEYLLDRGLGKATTKIADVTAEEKEKEGINIDKELKDFKVIEIK